VINTAGGQLIARMNGLTPAQGINVSTMLHNRGEFTLILATLAAAAGLDPRLTPFAGLYVLSMAVIGPVLAVNSERLGALGPAARRARKVDDARDREFALAEMAMAGGLDDDEPALEIAADEFPVSATDATAADLPAETRPPRERDPEY
jgi:CPA2 family monovalent cation:H+ antiporter-2